MAKPIDVRLGNFLTKKTYTDLDPETMSLEAIATAVQTAVDAIGAGTSVEDIADGVWDEATSGHASAGTFGKAITDILAAGGGGETAVPAADATDNDYTSDVVGNKADAAQTTVGTTRSLMAYLKGCLNEIAAIKGYVDTEIAAIKAKTDNLPSDPADASVVAGNITTATSNSKAMADQLSGTSAVASASGTGAGSTGTSLMNVSDKGVLTGVMIMTRLGGTGLAMKVVIDGSTKLDVEWTGLTFGSYPSQSVTIPFHHRFDTSCVVTFGNGDGATLVYGVATYTID